MNQAIFNNFDISFLVFIFLIKIHT